MKPNQLVVAVASVFADKLPAFKAPDGEHKVQLQAGADKADSFLRAEAGQQFRRIALWTEVAKFATKEQALAFCDGFAARSKELSDMAEKSKVESDKEIAAGVASDVSRMRRVARAVFGYETKDSNGKTKQVKGWGQEKVIKHLTGPGKWADKIGSLPGGRGKPGKAETPVQRRISAAKDIPAAGSQEALEKVLGIPSGTAISKPKQAEHLLVATVKSAPDALLMPLVKAIADRLLTSKDESMKDLGTSIRDAVKMDAVAPKKRKAAREQPAEQK